MTKTLGLIGFGQFGRLAASLLASRFDIVVHDAAGLRETIEGLGLRAGALEEAAACDVVVIAVPVAAMREVLERAAPHVKPGALVVDVGSVKVLPVRWMTETLPAHADIVATHPLFGPQSARGGLEGQRLVICPVRGTRHHRIAEIAESLGLVVSITTPEKHDEEMAYVQALTHLIGRALVSLDIPDEALKTKSYQHLLDLCGLVGGDSFELFTAIQTMNPHARGVAERFVSEAQRLLEQANETNPT
jgi:prephenate dehydrogenase